MGDIPPYNKDAEEAVLGAMLISDDAVAVAVDQLTAEDFYVPANVMLFRCIVGLHASGRAADPLTVADALTRSGELDKVGGPQQLISIQASTPSLGNVKAYASVVRDASTLRRLQAAAKEITRLTKEEGAADVSQLLRDAERLVFEVGVTLDEDSLVDSSKLLGDMMAELAESWLAPDGLAGVSSGFSDLDEITSGLRKSSLLILGARPGMGKSALALNMASHVAIHEQLPTVIFNVEMRGSEVVQRIVNSRSQVSLRSKGGRTRMSHDDWIRAREAFLDIDSAPLVMDNSPSLTAADVYARSKRVQSRFGGIGLIVVDYLQQMSGNRSENRQQEISDISRRLKMLGMDLDCPVLALSQLSRSLESRSDKRPMLSDLRESGSLEQDADVVMLLYQEGYYDEHHPDAGIAELNVAKHRQGERGLVKLAFIPEQSRFATIAKGA